MRSRFVIANGIRSHYSELGDSGPVIVALHGGGPGTSGATAWEPVAKQLGVDFRFIALDSVGGYGETDPSIPLTHGLQSRVEHFAAFADALCLDRFTLMGNSQGAWCATKYAELNPDRVDRLVLIASASITKAMGIESPQTEAMRILASYDGTAESMRRFLGAIVHRPEKITDELVERRQAAVNAPGVLDSFRGAVKLIRALQQDPILKLTFDMQHTLPTLTKIVPTIFIWGEDDQFALPSEGRKLVPMLPDVRFNWLKDAGHQVQTDQPEIVASLVREFVAAVAPVGV